MTGEILHHTQKSSKGKDHGYETHHSFIKFICFLSVPAAQQRGPFSVRENSDPKTAFVKIFIYQAACTENSAQAAFLYVNILLPYPNWKRKPL